MGERNWKEAGEGQLTHMVSDEAKEKLLQELEKAGNIYVSCSKAGVHRSSFYRWKEEDSEFAEKAEIAERRGRENICDIAEHSLMINVKEKKMDAIKYVLSHNHPVYIPKKTDKSETVIRHERGMSEEEISNFIHERQSKQNEAVIAYCAEREEEFKKTGILPKWYRCQEDRDAYSRWSAYIEEYRDLNPGALD